MSRLISRTLAHRREEDRRSRIAARVAVCVVLLMLGITSSCVSYLFLRYTDQIAAHTHDPWQQIGMLGIWAAVVAFFSFIAVPLVAAGLHETK